MSRTLKSLLLVPAVTFGIYACSGDDAAEHEEAALPGWEDVRTDLDTGTPGTTDEALASFASAMSRAPLVDPSQAENLTAPAAGALPRSPIPTFTWKVGATASRQWAVPQHRFANVGDAFGLRVEQNPFAHLLELFGPIRLAHAHGTPFSGTGTLLSFASSSSPKLLRVFTGSSTFTPSTADWDKLAAAGSFSLELVSAVFADNRLLQDGGPYQGSKTDFTVAP